MKCAGKHLILVGSSMGGYVATVASGGLTAVHVPDANNEALRGT